MNNVIKVTIWGESHQKYIGGTIENLAPGIHLELDFIKNQLSRRRGELDLSTPRKEKDDFEIVSGYYNGYTTGEPLTIIIKNNDVDSSFYEKNRYVMRPSHADYTSFVKSFGFNDNRGGGHHSGRISAGLVALGSIALQILFSKGINIFTHIYKIKGISDISLLNYIGDLNELCFKLLDKSFPVIDEEVEAKMKDLIIKTKEEKDSLGAILETCIFNLNPGFGGAYFESLEASISKSIFSIPSIKGVEFGLGFDFVNFKGSQVNDEFRIKDEKVVTSTNNNGGINGGISNGMPIIIKSVVKPTASIAKKQQTVDINEFKETTIKIKSRHDPCIASRISVVIDSVVALTILDEICLREGYLWMR